MIFFVFESAVCQGSRPLDQLFGVRFQQDNIYIFASAGRCEPLDYLRITANVRLVGYQTQGRKTE